MVAAAAIAVAAPPATFLAVCPGCGGVWQASGSPSADLACARCGLTRTEAMALLGPALRAYAEARRLAAAGRYAAADAYLTVAEQGGLSGQPEIEHLRVLCRAGAALTLDSPSAYDSYAAARDAAAQRQWKRALTSATAALHDVPESVPVRELYLLCLAALAVTEKASPPQRPTRQRSLHRDVRPSVRWSAGRPQSRKAIAPLSAAVPVRRKPDLFVVLLAAMSGTFALAVVAVMLAVAALRRPVAVVGPSVAAAAAPAPVPVLRAAAPMPAPLSALPANLRRDYDEAQRAMDEQIACRWLNDGLEALRRGDPIRAEAFANAAYRVGSRTYLAEETLLLAARAADNQNSPRAAAVWARLATECPQSSYAPMALLRAIGTAKRQKRADLEEKYARLLRVRYPQTPEVRLLAP